MNGSIVGHSPRTCSVRKITENRNIFFSCMPMNNVVTCVCICVLFLLTNTVCWKKSIFCIQEQNIKISIKR